MATPKPRATPYKSDTKKPAPYTGDTAKKKYQEQISPDGMAAAEAAARKAIEDKYPGMFMPKTRTTPGMYRSR